MSLRSTVSGVSVWEGDWSYFLNKDNSLTTIAMWRKLFSSVPAFRAPKAPCRSFKSSSRAVKDFNKGELIHLIYFMYLYRYGVKLCRATFNSRVPSIHSRVSNPSMRKVILLILIRSYWRKWRCLVYFLGASSHVI